MVKPVAFVGDVHGDAVRLARLLERSVDWERPLVFLGDYVNRGADSAAVLRLLSLAVARGDVALLGNHDYALLQYLDGTLGFADFAALGGAATIRSYVNDPRGDVRSQLIASVPADHLALLRGLVPFWESPSVFASHTGYDPEHPKSRAAADVAMRGHANLFHDRSRPAETVVCGHYTQRTGEPYISPDLVCLDTGCGSGGPLTAWLWPERTVFQF